MGGRASAGGAARLHVATGRGKGLPSLLFCHAALSHTQRPLAFRAAAAPRQPPRPSWRRFWYRLRRTARKRLRRPRSRPRHRSRPRPAGHAAQAAKSARLGAPVAGCLCPRRGTFFPCGIEEALARLLGSCALSARAAARLVILREVTGAAPIISDRHVRCAVRGGNGAAGRPGIGSAVRARANWRPPPASRVLSSGLLPSPSVLGPPCCCGSANRSAAVSRLPILPGLLPIPALSLSAVSLLAVLHCVGRVTRLDAGLATLGL
jgi:hypothetical protein